MKKTLFRMLYYLYCDQNYASESDLALMNLKNSFISQDMQITLGDINACLENDNNTNEIISIDAKVNNEQPCHGNESLSVPHVCHHINKQTRRKSISEFPESIRYKLQYFESKSACRNCIINTDKLKPIKISNLPEEHRIPCPRPPPVVVGVILKRQPSAIDSDDIMWKPDVSLVNHDSSDKLLDLSVLSNKDTGNERFLINLYEPRQTKQCDKEKKFFNSSLISMATKLFIKDLSMDYTKPSETSVQVTNPPVALREVFYLSFQDSTRTSDGSSNNSANTSINVMRKACNQRLVMQQAARAVLTCKQTKVFENSIQRVEAERILLTAGLKRDHFLMQLQNCRDSKIQDNAANLTISNIKLPFNSDEISDNHQVWVVASCTTKSTFHMTPMVQLSSQSTENSCIKIPGMYVFENVSPDFRIKLCVYEMKIADGDKKKKSKFTRTLKKKFRSRTLSSEMEANTTSSFIMGGWVDFTLNNFQNDVLNLNSTSMSSIFKAVHFSGSAFSLVLNRKHSGFVTVGSEVNGYVVWDRNWCSLLNSILYFWSNPSEESLNDFKNFIDLRNCVIGRLENMWIRPNTLVLESTRDAENAITNRYYLSYDNPDDLKNWRDLMSSILDTLRHWKSLMYV